MKKGALYKPLVKSLKSLDTKLYWLLPIVKNIKNSYNIDDDIAEELIDIDDKSIESSLLSMEQIINNYQSNDTPDGENNYKYLVRSLNSYHTPYLEPTTTLENGCLDNIEVKLILLE